MSEAVCVVIKDTVYFVKDMDVELFKNNLEKLGLKYSRVYHTSFLCSEGLIKIFDSLEELKKHLEMTK